MWLVFHPLGLELDKVLFDWNSVTMILKLLITRGNITLIPKEATQEKEKVILKSQPVKLKKNEKEKENMKSN